MKENLMTNSRYTLLLWIFIGLSLILYLSSSLKVRSDISFFLPEKNYSEQQDTIDSVMQHQLHHGEAGKIILISLSVKESASSLKTSKKQLAEISKKLTLRLKQQTQFVSVHNGQFSSSELIVEPYYQYRYLLQSDSDDKFSSEDLSQSFNQLLQQLQLMPGPMEQRLFSEDPQMIWLSLLKKWQTETIKKEHGVWFDQQGRQSILFVKTQAQAYDLKQQKINVEILRNAINSLTEELTHVDYILTGAPVFALESKKSISKQIKVISVIASFVLIAFLYYFFRSIKITLLVSLPLAFAILTGMTMVVLIDGFIHGITIAFGITIIGIAVDYPVHLYSHILYLSNDSSTSLPTRCENTQMAIMQRIWPLIRLGLITTLIGFSAIILSDFSGLRQLGVFAISGLLMAAAVTRFLLPHIPINYDNQNKDDLYNENRFRLLSLLVSVSIPKLMSYLFIILPLIALIYIGMQSSSIWQKDLSAMSPIPQKQKKQDFELRKAMALPELRYAFILKAETIEAVLQQSELLKVHLNALTKQDVISGYDMANHYLPSIKFQKHQQEKLPEGNVLKERLNKLFEKTPFSIEAFSPFIDAVEKSKSIQPLVYQSVLNNEANTKKENFISDKIKSLLFHDGQWTALISLQGVFLQGEIKKLPVKKINQEVNFTVQLLDLKSQSESMLSQYRNEALLWFILGALLIILVLFFYIRNVKELFVVVWPFIGAVTLTVASLLLLGYSLSIFHLVTLLLVIGLSIDYSIFMLGSHRVANKLLHSTMIGQVSVIICLISTLIMFGALSLSDLPVLKAIGLTASLGAFYAFILARASLNLIRDNR